MVGKGADGQATEYGATIEESVTGVEDGSVVPMIGASLIAAGHPNPAGDTVSEPRSVACRRDVPVKAG